MLLPNKRTAVRLLFGSSWPIADRQLMANEIKKQTVE